MLANSEGLRSKGGMPSRAKELRLRMAIARSSVGRISSKSEMYMQCCWRGMRKPKTLYRSPRYDVGECRSAPTGYTMSTEQDQRMPRARM